MFTHVVVGSNDLERSRQFYDAVMAVLGYGEGIKDHNEQRRRYMYRAETGAFFVSEPLNGLAASHANGGTVGFACDSRLQVDRWHEAGVMHGGTSIEMPPGWRGPEKGGAYLAYLRDPDGNKLCAVYRIPD
jgi:catechol 2,3-dioxygenase-like lactoylglutathione lyase family enzyme